MNLGIFLGALAGFAMGLVLYTLISVGFIVMQGLEPMREYQPITIFSIIATMSGLLGGAAGALVGLGTPRQHGIPQPKFRLWPARIKRSQ